MKGELESKQSSHKGKQNLYNENNNQPENRSKDENERNDQI